MTPPGPRCSYPLAADLWCEEPARFRVECLAGCSDVFLLCAEHRTKVRAEDIICGSSWREAVIG